MTNELLSLIFVDLVDPSLVDNCSQVSHTWPHAGTPNFMFVFLDNFPVAWQLVCHHYYNKVVSGHYYRYYYYYCITATALLLLHYYNLQCEGRTLFRE